jgi:cycloeucalenol cycloisomerase
MSGALPAACQRMTTAVREVARADSGYWFSRNPSKAWGEKFFLAYSPFWILGMGVLMKTGVGGRWHDAALNLAILAIAAPAVVVPALIRDESALGRRWYETYWLKFNLWIAIFATVGSYFGSEYFFDVLGMTYDYPQLRWRLDSTLLGTGQQTVPLIMYASAYYYFLTYHTCAVLVMRRVRTSRVGANPLLWPLIVLAAAYGFAYLETYFMAGGSIAEQFGYRDLPRMLRWGSLVYACYFVVSFPMVYRLDEDEDENWPLPRVCFEALAAGMLVLFLLDGVTHVIGTL